MSKKTPVGVLTAAYNLLLDPKRWIQGAMATDKDGYSVRPETPKAVCFCSIGAIRRVAPLKYDAAPREMARSLLSRAAHQEFGVNPVCVNDDLGHDIALLMFEKAIELGKRQEAERV